MKGWFYEAQSCQSFSRCQINVNDELTFNVVEEYATSGYSFETLDYFLESYDLIAEGAAANIEDYLVR